MTCACGVSTLLPASDVVGRADQAGPYRAPAAVAPPPLELRCPYCGNACAATVRVCPHCDVRLDKVRCERCWSLQPPGSFECARCGQALALEPLLDPTDAPCPRCTTPLEVRGGAGESGHLHECPRCGGTFVLRDVLADILHRAERGGPFPDQSRATVTALDQVKYVPCPLCHSPMNRINFGKVSGVIVDVCRQHGTWFDGGELTRVVAFAANGGLDKTRAREKKELDEQSRQQVVAQRDFAVFMARESAEERLQEWRRFLELLLW